MGIENRFLALQGQKVAIPDIDAIFGDWPSSISPHYEDLKTAINAELDRRLPPGPKLTGVKSVDLPLLVCIMWPLATYEDLIIGSNLMLWAFLWDDEVDVAEPSHGNESPDPFKKLREDTIECLNWYRQPEPGDSEKRRSNRVTISSIDPWGSAVRDKFQSSNRTALLDECILAVRAQGDEQAIELRGEPPSIDEYLRYRVHSIGIGLELAMLEHTLRFDPGELRDDPDMKDIWYYAKLNGAFVNDVISLKKELKYPTASNIIKILYLQCGDIQKAIVDTCGRIVDSVARLDAAARRLMEKHPRESDVVFHDKLQQFISGVRGLCFGQYKWAISSPRYKLCVQTLVNGLEIQL